MAADTFSAVSHSWQFEDRHTLSSDYLWPIILVILFSAIFITRLTGIGIISQFDELFLLSVLMLGFLTGTLSGKVHRLLIYYLAGIATLTILSLLGGERSSMATSLLSSVLILKFVPVAYVFRQAPSADLRCVMSVLLAYCVIGGLASFSMPTFFQSLLPETSFTLDGGRMIGFFVNPNRQGALASILFIYFWFVRDQKMVGIVLLVILFLTASRSYLVLTVFLFLYASHVAGRRLSLFVVAPVLLSVFGYLLIFEFNILDTIEKAQRTLDSDLRYIRAAMLVGGFTLALENFPFGAGGGQFGSPLSVGSQTYVGLGIDGWATVIDGTGIHDNGVGTILGEYGFLGFFALGIVLFHTLLAWGGAQLTRMDIFFLLGIIVFQSLFRQVISDFYFSFITLSFGMIILKMRRAKLKSEMVRNAFANDT